MTVTIILDDRAIRELLLTLSSSPVRTDAARLLEVKLLDVQLDPARAA